ncbi:MAG: UDP-N-acetylglucosamine 1-carboxyvinyltransferase [Ruminococcaceae bacterium]|nr:UDP-N-acetylglucosamine 1-carboxyvinyltransferase [Oscillospiraceae bacterium]
MKKIKIRGGHALKGQIEISGMKNAALPILFATIVTGDVCVIENLPPVGDIEVTLEILHMMGAKVTRHSPTVVEIDTRDIKQGTSPAGMVRRLRGSNYLIGAELARFGRAKVGTTGGCNFGERPIDLHVKGFTALGATVTDGDGFVSAHVSGCLKGTKIVMDKISVGATANILIAATTAQGMTIIENAAHEPHIVDLASFLNSCGAHISGAGTSVIKVRGVEKLHGCHYTIIPDMIEAGTYMVAAAATHGELVLNNVISRHLDAVSAKMREMGIIVIDEGDCITVRTTGSFNSAKIQAVPYPGFATDMQPQITALLSLASGISTVTENVFKKRFQYVEELQRMGAAISVDDQGSTATVLGVHKLHGATVTALDLRAGAAMVIAGLAAEGETCVLDVETIERGYYDIVGKLRSVGADIELVEE